MNEVFTLMPDITADAMGQMSDDVKAFAKETGKLPEEVIPALYQAISAGVPPDNVFDFLRTANKGAVAGVANITEEVSLLSAVTKGYGDTSQEAVKKAADLAQLQVKLGQTTIPELARSYGQAVPLAAALGVSQEELAASSASLFGVTGNTSEVMTQLKAVFTALITQNPKLAAALKKLGFSTSGAAIEALGLQGTLQGLVKATGGSTQELQGMLGSAEAVTAALALTGAQSETFTGNLDAMAESTGTVDKAFERMDGGIKATTGRILAGIKVWALEVGEQLKDLGPLFTLFGPTAGRAIGAGLGAGAGLVARAVPTLLKPLAGLGIRIATFIAAELAASTVATRLASGLARSIAAIPGASTVKTALTRAGTLMGSRLALGIALGLATLGVVIVIEEIQKQVDENETKLQQIGADVGKQIATGATAQLEQSRDAIKTAIEEIEAATKRGPIQMATPQQIEALKGLVEQYNLVQTELNKRAEASARATQYALEGAKNGTAQAAQDLVGELPTALEKSQARTRGAAADFARKPIAEQLVLIGHDARQAGAQAALQLADGLRSARANIGSALDQLREDMKNRLTPKAEVGLRIGQLFSRTLAKGLKDSDPVIKAQAEGTRALIEDQLIETIKAGGEAGKKIQEELEKKLKSKDPAVKAQAERTKSVIDAALKATPGKNPGDVIGDELAKDLANSNTQLGKTAYTLGRTIARNILAGVKGTGYVAPASTSGVSGQYAGKSIPLYDSGTGYVPFDQLAVVHRGEIVVPEAPASAIRAGDAVLSGGAPTSGGDTYHNTWVMPEPTRDPWAALEATSRYVRWGRLKPEGDRG